MKVDLAWGIYAATCLLAWYGFGLFGWWWLKKGKATAVYGYVTFLLLGIAISTTGSIYVRWFLEIDYDLYKYLLNTWWWAARLWITFLSVALIVGHMSYRIFWQKYRDET